MAFDTSAFIEPEKEEQIEPKSQGGFDDSSFITPTPAEKIEKIFKKGQDIAAGSAVKTLTEYGLGGPFEAFVSGPYNLTRQFQGIVDKALGLPESSLPKEIKNPFVNEDTSPILLAATALYSPIAVKAAAKATLPVLAKIGQGMTGIESQAYLAAFKDRRMISSKGRELIGKELVKERLNMAIGKQGRVPVDTSFIDESIIRNRRENFTDLVTSGINEKEQEILDSLVDKYQNVKNMKELQGFKDYLDQFTRYTEKSTSPFIRTMRGIRADVNNQISMINPALGEANLNYSVMKDFEPELKKFKSLIPKNAPARYIFLLTMSRVLGGPITAATAAATSPLLQKGALGLARLAKDLLPTETVGGALKRMFPIAIGASAARKEPGYLSQ